MKYTQATGEKSTVKLTIDFTAEEWEKAIGEAYKKTRGKYSVPGFRKGKAPKPVLENYYGKGVFYEEAFNYLYREYYFGIIEKEKENFTAVGEPELSVENISDDKGVTLTAVVPVKPEVKLAAYTGLKIQKYEYNVTDNDVKKEMNKILESKAEEKVVEGRAAKDGDKANLNFSGSVNGEKFAGGTAENYDLVLGSGSFIPGFEAQVEGMNVGEEKTIKVTFPEDYQADDLRGKEAEFEIKLNKLSEKIYPELTDEYVKANAGQETVADYEASVRKKLEDSAAKRSRDDTENSILAELCKQAEVEIPDAMIQNEIDGIVQDFSYRLMYQGLKLEDYIKYMGQTMQQFRDQFKGQAHQRVLSQLIIDKIIREEKIEATEEEIDAKIKEQAESVSKEFEEYKKNLDPRQAEYIKNDIIITKLFKYLEENNELFVKAE